MLEPQREWTSEVAATTRGRAGLVALVRDVADAAGRDALLEATLQAVDFRLEQLEGRLAELEHGKPWSDGTRFDDGTGWAPDGE